jgi:succinyl-CoA synthetase beta subunit
MDEAAAKTALAAFGLMTPEGRIVSSAEATVEAAETLGFPVVVKALGINHKSEAGAVRLNLASAAAVAAAAGDLTQLSDRLLIEKMVGEGVAELLIGVRREPPFGLLMTVGAGGVLAELLADSASFLLPASEGEIRAALQSLKVGTLLQGYRGGPRGDLDAAVTAAVAIQRYAEANLAAIEEVEVNPLIVRPDGNGAFAADALIRTRTND